ncbi:MAG: aldo/keto reductase [Betaproteobacteria bacterium]|nr:aldo/keto reductase [Betaproteobacteria bacterium]
MNRRPLGRSGIEIAPLVFGGNVFGWTADKATSHALLDRFVAAGLDAIDTADVYSRWVPGNQGGESETIIGEWLAASPRRRDQVVIITKAGSDKGLAGKRVLEAAEASLKRLRTDRIDVYLAHKPDPRTPIDETLRAFEQLMRQGKVRVIGSSNDSAAQLRQALDVAAGQGLPRFEVQQPEYNLYDRSGYEGALRDLCIAEGIGVITYYSLASGFLSGKYRSSADLNLSVRGAGVRRHLDARGVRILAALDEVARAHAAKPAEVALAWLIARKGVTAPIASATSIEQLESLVRATELTLAPEEIDRLTAASD